MGLSRHDPCLNDKPGECFNRAGCPRRRHAESTKKLVLSEKILKGDTLPVSLITSNGYHLDMRDLNVDFEKRSAHTDNEIIGKGPIGRFRADKMVLKPVRISFHLSATSLFALPRKIGGHAMNNIRGKLNAVMLPIICGAVLIGLTDMRQVHRKAQVTCSKQMPRQKFLSKLTGLILN